MIVKITETGEQLHGSSPIEIVNAFKSGGRFTEFQENKEYMKGFSEREKQYSGAEIRVDSEDNFVEDLLTSGYFTRIL